MATRRATVTAISTPAPPEISFESIESVLREQIAARAYEIYLERGGEHGHDVEDWVRAEHEILANAGEVVSV